MENLKKHARWLALFCKIIFIISPLWLLFFWLQGIQLWNGFLCVKYAYNLDPDFFILLQNVTVIQRIIALFLESGGVLIFLTGLWYFAKLMACFQRDEVFSQNALELCKKVSKQALFFALYVSLKNMLLSVIMSLHNPVGQRIISLSFGLSDVINIILVSFLFVLTCLLEEAAKLKQEHDMTV